MMEFPKSDLPRPSLIDRFMYWWKPDDYDAWMRKRHKCLWRCLRDGGGGVLITPKPMTQEHAIAWVGRVVNGEVFHVDFDNRFIFYRSHS